MKLDMDTIQFESREEVEAVITALDEWQKKNEKNECVQSLLDKLRVMHIMW